MQHLTSKGFKPRFQQIFTKKNLLFPETNNEYEEKPNMLLDKAATTVKENVNFLKVEKVLFINKKNSTRREFGKNFML